MSKSWIRAISTLTMALVALLARLVLILVLSFSLMMFGPLASPVLAADSAGDYRSKATGNWNATATWQRYDGAIWVDAVATPTSADGVITILDGHTVTVTSAVTVDQVIINAGGQVTIGGVILTVANGAGVDLQVNGTLNDASGTLTLQASSEVRVSGTLTVSGTGTFSMGATGVALYFNAGSTLSWNRNAGTLPPVSKTFWASNSTCEIVGVTATIPGNIDQSYGNLTWNCPSQTSAENLGSNVSVAGNFTLVDTGSGSLRTGTTANGTVSIGGNFIQSGGSLQTTTSGTRTVNVRGNFTMSSGTLTMSAGSGTATINVSGNFSHAGGTITETSTGAGAFVFNKSGTQSYTSGGTISNTINFTVNSGSTLQMAAAGTTVSGAGAFTLSSGAGLGITSADGISSSDASGNIQVTGTRTFSTGANYTYNGTAAQVTGNGLPATVNTLIISNTGGDVTLGAAATVNGMLTLTSGNIITNSYYVAIGSGGSVSRTNGHVVGNLQKAIDANGTVSRTFEVGTGSDYTPIDVAISGVAGSGGGQTLTGSSTSGEHLNLPESGIDRTRDVNRYWTLTLAGTWTFTSYDTTFNFVNSDIDGGANTSSFVLRKFTSGAWSTPPGGVVTAANSTTGNGFTSFSDYAVGEAITWESYESVERTTVRNAFNSTYYIVYMKGTGFTNTDYLVAYYDGNGTKRGSETITVTTGTLNSLYDLTSDQYAGPGTWHALVQPSTGYTGFGTESYDTIVASPDTYGLLANDSFEVAQSAIPEFPTVVASVMVAGLCLGIYLWLRKKQEARVKA